MITTVCKISYGSQTVPPIVPAVQGDTGRAISFEIADFTPPAGATATYFILKPSGEAIYNSATITNNSILCELTAQSLAEAGENRMQVRVLQGEDIVTSFEVILMVRTFLGDDAIESGTEMNIFDQAVEQATEQFQEQAEEIVEEVLESIPEDYTALTEEVDELNERLIQVDNKFLYPFSYGKNRANKNDLSLGYLNTSGNLTPNVQDWITTNFCYVHDLTNIVFSVRYKSNSKRHTYPLYYLCTYDKDQNFIAQVYTNTDNRTYEIPENVYYIRCCYHGDTVDNPQIESGTTETLYAEYNLILKDTSLPEDVNIIAESYIPVIKRVENDITNTKYVDITSQFTLSDGYIDNRNGNLVSYETGKSTDYLNIFEYGDLYITGSSPYSSNCLYAIYDVNHVFLGYHKNGTETNYHFKWTDIISQYPNAYYVRFSTITTVSALTIKRASTIVEIIADFSSSVWRGKKWTCVGDSLTEVNSRTTKHYFDYVAEATGVNIVNLGASGRGYKNPSSVDNKTFLDVITEVPTDSDVVTIFGSGNDLTHGYTLGDVTDTGTTTICGCINETLDALIDRFPTVQLGVVAPTPWVNFPPSTANNAMELYVNALKTICANRSIPFLDLYHCSNLRPWTAEGRAACYSKDGVNGVHPDEEGHKLIAPRFKGFLDTLLI